MAMNILYLAPDVSYPPSHGLTMRTWSVVRGLSAIGHRVTVMGFASEHAGGSPPSEVCLERMIVDGSIKSLSSSLAIVGRLRAMLRGKPFSAVRFLSAAMKDSIASRLEGGRFDAVVADTAFVSANLPERLSVPLIVNTHNIEHLLLRRYSERERRPLHRCYAELEWRRLRAWESTLWKRSQLVLACSHFDGEQVEALAPQVRCAVVPNVVDVNILTPRQGAEPATVVFTGGLDWYPNRDGVTYFVKDVFPDVRRKVPHARFVIAGRSGSEALRDFLQSHTGVECLGPVSDMQEVLVRATLCVVPLRIGSGTRLKILEAAAMGKAIVSTSLGAEGLEFSPVNELAIADNAAGFSEAVVRLLGDVEARTTMGNAARKRVVSQYSQERLTHYLQEAISGGSRKLVAPVASAALA